MPYKEMKVYSVQMECDSCIDRVPLAKPQTVTLQSRSLFELKQKVIDTHWRLMAGTNKAHCPECWSVMKSLRGGKNK